MYTLANRIKYLIVLHFLFFSISAGAQISESISMEIQNLIFVPDTSDKEIHTLFFSVRMNDVSNSKLLNVALKGRGEKVLIHLGNYEVKKHATGFYYIENEMRDIRTVFDQEIYFSVKLEKKQMKRAKSIDLDYLLYSGESKSIKKNLPEN